MLIHAFAYSFVGIYSVISNMTGYSHSCLSIKLIHWGAPEGVVNDDSYFYFMLCQSYLLSTVISVV